MKKVYYSLGVSGFLLLLICFVMYQNTGADIAKTGSGSLRTQKKMSKTGLLAMQAEYQFSKLRNPKIGSIPPGIRAKELAYVSTLPAYSEGEGQAWNGRGPSNIGGRMLCIAVDVENENHLLAGSASGGMWETSEPGQIWHKTTFIREHFCYFINYFSLVCLKIFFAFI